MSAPASWTPCAYILYGMSAFALGFIFMVEVCRV